MWRGENVEKACARAARAQQLREAKSARELLGWLDRASRASVTRTPCPSPNQFLFKMRYNLETILAYDHYPHPHVPLSPVGDLDHHSAGLGHLGPHLPFKRSGDTPRGIPLPYQVRPKPDGQDQTADPSRPRHRHCLRGPARQVHP